MDYLDTILHPNARVPNGPGLESFGFDPESYDPTYDEMSLVPGMENSPVLNRIQQYTQGRKAIAGRTRDSQEAQAATPALLGLDPENPLFSHQLNQILSKDPDAITNPRVASILGFKEKLARHPEFTAEDITDPELLQKWKEREALGMDWRQNHQQHVMDTTAKQRRLELRGMGASPDQLVAVMDPKTGYISDDDYAGIKYHLAANQKQPMAQGHIEKLAELETQAEREPTPEEKLAYLKQTYPKLDQKQYTKDHWDEAYRALTPKRNVLNHYLRSLVSSGVNVDPEILSKYGIKPTITRWDPKGKKVLVDASATAPALVSENQAPLDASKLDRAAVAALPSGTLIKMPDGSIRRKK